MESNQKEGDVEETPRLQSEEARDLVSHVIPTNIKRLWLIKSSLPLIFFMVAEE